MNTQYRKNLKAVLEASKTYCDESIDSLKWELGTYDLSVDSDTTSAYQKVVPANSIEAKINTLGGMSYKTTNLYSGEQNKTITINNTFYDTFKLLDNFKSGTTYTLSFDYKQVSGDTNEYYLTLGYGNTGYTVDANIGSSSLVNGKITTTFTPNNTNYSNLYIRIPRYESSFSGVFSLDNIMINEGSTALPYEPYYSGFRDTAPTSVKSLGSNLFDEVVKLGTLSATGDADESSATRLMTSNYLKVKPNTIYSFNNQYVARINFYNSTKSFISTMVYSNQSITTPSNCCYLRFDLGAGYGTTYNHDIMLNLGSTALPYKPYFTASLLIPAQVQALDGYGWGLNSTCYNYIDFNAKKFIKKANKYTFTGNESCGKVAGTTPLYNIRLEGAKNDDSNALLTSSKWHMSFVSASSLVGTYGVEIQGNMIYFQPPSDVITTEAQLLTEITGLTIEYEMTIPVETDISAYLTTNKITVEGGGTLTMENTYGASVPSDIDYLKEVAK